MRLGVRQTISLGCLILMSVSSLKLASQPAITLFSAGYSSTYWALHSSFWLVVFTIGLCHGLAFITVYAVANGAAQRWFPVERRGLIASIVARSVLGGAGRHDLITV